MPIRKRLLELFSVAVLGITITALVVWGYVKVVLNAKFPVEARLINSEGKMVFVPFDRRLDDQKTYDEIAASAAVLQKSGLWISHLVMVGDKEYAFCPFGKVYVLRGGGFDTSEVESSTVWHGEPHDFPFSARDGG